MAEDGQPSADELKRRRAAREQKEKEAAAGSSQDRAAAAAAGDEQTVEEADDGQLFVWEQGTKVTLGTLVGRNVPVKHAFVFGGKRVKGQGGLMALDEHPLLVVEGATSKVAVVPEHDEKGKVKSVTVEMHIGAQAVHPADSDQAEALIAPVLADRAARRKAG